MALIAIRWKYLKNDERLGFAGAVHKALSENPQLFTDLPVPLAVFAQQVAAFQKAQQDCLDSSPSRRTIRNKAREDVYISLSRLGRHVQILSRGDESIILKSGFKCKASSYPRSKEIKAPLIKKLSRTNTEGEVKVSWYPVKNAHAYQVSYSTNIEDESSWVEEEFSTSIKTTIKKVPFGIVWFRVRAIGKAGGSDFSAAVSIRV
jgi:hypothetical protein